MTTTTLTDFRKEMKQHLDRITDTLETLIINRGKDRGVVLLSMAEYNEYLHLKENSHQTSVKELQSIDSDLADVKPSRTKPRKKAMKLFDKYVQG
jgi:antitoxin YefM